MKILSAMATPDGRWRVEVIQRGSKVTYRLLDGGQVVPGITAIGSIRIWLDEHGVDMGDLVEAQAWQPLAGPGAA